MKISEQIKILKDILSDAHSLNMKYGYWVKNWGPTNALIMYLEGELKKEHKESTSKLKSKYYDNRRKRPTY